MPEDTTTPTEESAAQITMPETGNPGGYSWTDAETDALTDSAEVPAETEEPADEQASDDNEEESDPATSEDEAEQQDEDESDLPPLDPPDEPETAAEEPSVPKEVLADAQMYQSIERDLLDPQKAQALINRLAQFATEHGVTVEPPKVGAATMVVTPPEEGWASPGEEQLANLANALAAQVAALTKEVHASKDVIATVQQQREQLAADQEFQSRVKAAYPQVREAIAKRYSGYRVSEQDVADAMREYSKTKMGPGEATAKHVMDRIVRHMAKVSGKRAEKGPELPNAVGKKGARDYGAPGKYDWKTAELEASGL